ncbi:hypothetical protein DFQ29_009711 [Apophysomyces sp. BC1021]|nr:hypothetical protein DFQ29_009711 [Apophysomyces sp. BC1021]
MSSNAISSSNAAVSSRKKPVAWENDGVEPHNMSSMTVLIEWLTTPGNYDAWRSSKNSPFASKKVLGSQIGRSKISSVQINFSKAADWLSNTSNGVNDERHIRDVVKNICKYYYDLEPYFGDRPFAIPAFPNWTDGDDEAARALLLSEASDAEEDEETSTSTTRPEQKRRKRAQELRETKKLKIMEVQLELEKKRIAMDESVKQEEMELLQKKSLAKEWMTSRFSVPVTSASTRADGCCMR